MAVDQWIKAESCLCYNIDIKQVRLKMKWNVIWKIQRLPKTLKKIFPYVLASLYTVALCIRQQTIRKHCIKNKLTHGIHYDWNFCKMSKVNSKVNSYWETLSAPGSLLELLYWYFDVPDNSKVFFREKPFGFPNCQWVMMTVLCLKCMWPNIASLWWGITDGKF